MYVCMYVSETAQISMCIASTLYIGYTIYIVVHDVLALLLHHGLLFEFESDIC